MAREFSRTQRIAEQIRREMAALLLREIHDPRLAGVTVAGVEVSRDLSHATIFVSSLLETDRAPVEAGLDKARGFIRSHLAKAVKMRSVPMLHFVFDTTDIDANRMDALIDEAVRRDQH